MKNLPKLCAFLAVISIVTPSVCQLPNTNVYCLDMEKFGEQIEFKNPKFLTAFNPQGYNNQPQWVNNNELYIAVQTPYDTSQTEIFSLSLLNSTLTQVTATRESEYSPTLMPDRKNVSCIRVDATRAGTQRLWTYPIDRANSGRDILPLHQDIGYHCWLSDKKLALFIVSGASNYLKLVNVEDQSSIQLQSGIGRSLARMSDGKLAFVQKATAQTWYIKSMDANSYNTDIIIETLPGSEDFTFLPDGTFIMGNGSKLFSYKIGSAQKQWTEIADLSKYGITNIKRLTVSRDLDKIAIVNDVVYRR
jgi:hypothetical protein